MSELTTEQLTQLYEDWSAMGEKRERERIIKLLQEHLLAIDIFGETYCWICESSPYKGHLIALIKGESNV
jgi:hypothetical protein